MTTDKRLGERLHEWYLDATRKLKPESYNPNAQKEYNDLTEEQRFIDTYIADAIKSHILSVLPDEKVWNQCRGRDDKMRTDGYNQCRAEVKKLVEGV